MYKPCMLVVRHTLRISVCVSERTHLLQYPFKLLIHCRKARQTLLEVSKLPNHKIRALTSRLILNFLKIVIQEFLRNYFLAQIDAFEYGPTGVGWFFWNAKIENDVSEPWNYLFLLKNGIIPSDLCNRNRFCQF